jgi:transcription initiation factor TFIID subunit 5
MPVWDVKFCPLGYYFASASNDRTACIWNIKHHTPVRILAGHLSDVTTIEWHPNCQYVATGSSDCQVRLWSVVTGDCVRIMFTVESAVRCLKFTRAGLHLLAGNDSGSIVFFDLQAGVALEIIQTC